MQKNKEQISVVKAVTSQLLPAIREKQALYVNYTFLGTFLKAIGKLSLFFTKYHVIRMYPLLN